MESEAEGNQMRSLHESLAISLRVEMRPRKARKSRNSHIFFLARERGQKILFEGTLLFMLELIILLLQVGHSKIGSAEAVCWFACCERGEAKGKKVLIFARSTIFSSHIIRGKTFYLRHF